MKDLIIIGAGGLGREVAWTVERINNVNPEWNLIGFLDDNECIQGNLLNGYKVIGKTADMINYPGAYYVCAVGAAKVREKIINELKNANSNIKFGTIIDPSVKMSNTVTIGEGTIILVYAIVTVNICIGNHVIINYGCTIGHDTVIKDYVTLYPAVNVAGSTKIGHAVELGTGMQIIQGKKIGDYSIIGAGAVVVKDIPEKCTAVGTPAKPIRFYE